MKLVSKAKFAKLSAKDKATITKLAKKLDRKKPAKRRSYRSRY